MSKFIEIGDRLIRKESIVTISGIEQDKTSDGFYFKVSYSFKYYRIIVSEKKEQAEAERNRIIKELEE